MVLSAIEQHKKNMENQMLLDFYNSRPEQIKKMMEEYPWEYYKMKKNSPYGINPENTLVELIAYSESGHIRVGLHPEHLTEKGKQHIKLLCEQHNKDYNLLVSQPHSMHVSPEWLEPISEEEFNYSVNLKKISHLPSLN